MEETGWKSLKDGIKGHSADRFVPVTSYFARYLKHLIVRLKMRRLQRDEKANVCSITPGLLGIILVSGLEGKMLFIL